MWESADYSKENLPEMVKLAHEFYGESWISSHEFLNWQYEKNPAGQALIKLARDSETKSLVGQYVVIPSDFKLGEKVIKVSLSLNTLTKKEFWGKGIFTALAKQIYTSCSEKGHAFTFGFPNQNSYPGFVKKLGFKDIGRVPLLIRPLKPSNLVKKKFGSLLAIISSPVNLFYKTTIPSEKNTGSGAIFEITEDSLHLFDDFWNKAKDKYRVLGVRDSDFIKWRYYDIPLRDYKVYGIKDSTGLLGYIIGRVMDVDGIQNGMIVDFLVSPNRKEVGNSLLQAMLGHFVQNEVELVGSLLLEHSEEYEILKSNKFIKCPKFLEPQPFPIVLKSYDRDSEFEDLSNWFVTMGDYDVV